MKASNSKVRKYRSTTRKRRKSKFESGLHGRHSAKTDKSWHRKIHAQSSYTAIRRRDISDTMLRSRNMDSQQRTRKNDSIDATQDVTTHHSKRRYKKIEKQEIRTNEEIEAKYINDMSSFGDESEDGESSNTQRPGQRRVFRERYWGRNWHNRDWRGILDCEWLLIGTLNWAQDTGSTERSEDQEKDGKMTLTNSSNKNLKILKIQLKSNNQTNKTWVSIAKDRGNWAPQKKLTQRPRKDDWRWGTKKWSKPTSETIWWVRLSDEEKANIT